MKLGWLSDLHLDFLDPGQVHAFAADLAARDVDAWLLGGDIGQADSVARYLRALEAAVPHTIYFTLGNHDSYGGSLAGVAGEIADLVGRSERLVWLTTAEPQVLADDLALVGDDGWGDARFGNPLGTPIELNDFHLIEELSGLTRAALVRTLNDLGDAAAARLAPKLDRAASSCRRVLVVTHVPPFCEAAWYRGRPSDENFLPWFACRAVGEVILRCAQAHPDVEFLVLCGHTHGAGTCAPAANLTVYTAGATYGAPRVQGVIAIDASAASASWRLVSPSSGVRRPER